MLKRLSTPCNMASSALVFTPRSQRALPWSIEARHLLRVVPDPSSVVRPSKSPCDYLQLCFRQFPIHVAYRHLITPSRGRHFRCGVLSKRHGSCCYRITSPSQPLACGTWLPRGRQSLVTPQSLPLAVQ
jgi:hypothetical protein